MGHWVVVGSATGAVTCVAGCQQEQLELLGSSELWLVGGKIKPGSLPFTGARNILGPWGCELPVQGGWSNTAVIAVVCFEKSGVVWRRKAMHGCHAENTPEVTQDACMGHSCRGPCSAELCTLSWPCAGWVGGRTLLDVTGTSALLGARRQRTCPQQGQALTGRQRV